MIRAHGQFFMDKESLKRFEINRNEVSRKYTSINLDINHRWENGVKHHPRSIEIMNKIKELDFYFQSDYFCWKTGGDGDNGENLMYLLDIIFEHEDKLLVESEGK